MWKTTVAVLLIVLNMVSQCTYVALLRSKRPLSWMWNIKSPPFRYSITKKRCSCTKHYCQRTVADKLDMKSMWERMDSDKGGRECWSLSTTGNFALTAVAQVCSLSGYMLLDVLLEEMFRMCVLTLDWNVENRCVRKGFSQARASTLFSTMVHSTSSSMRTTSFFRTFTAKYCPCPFSSASSTWGVKAT